MTRAVFDCNLYLQALASPEGPAGRCVQLAFDRRFSLFLSPAILDEFRDVTHRPRVAAKLNLSPERVDEFVAAVCSVATLLEDFPTPFNYPRDQDDAAYVNLALAANAMLIVTWDKDLLDLMRDTNSEGQALRLAHSEFRVLTPPAFLAQFGAREK